LIGTAKLCRFTRWNLKQVDALFACTLFLIPVIDQAGAEFRKWNRPLQGCEYRDGLASDANVLAIAKLKLAPQYPGIESVPCFQFIESRLLHVMTSEIPTSQIGTAKHHRGLRRPHPRRNVPSLVNTREGDGRIALRGLAAPESRLTAC
jgi:hypothetical protein